MNKIIVFGSFCYNTLGLVRSLGMAGHSVIVVAHNKQFKDCIVRLSRYTREFHYVPDAQSGLDLLKRKFWNEPERPILLFSSDDAVLAVDSRYEEMKDRFIFFNARGRVAHYLDKINTFPVAEECGLTLIRSAVLDDPQRIPQGIRYPCLVKGANSTCSTKDDMGICGSESELREFVRPGVEYLVQDYIDKEYELNVVGLSYNHGRDVLVPAVIRKIRDDLHRQSVYMRLDGVDDYPLLDIGAIGRIVEKIGYEGIFSVELLFKDGKYYFLEINLRNDGCGFLYTAAGVNYPQLWVMYAQGRLTPEVAGRVKARTPFFLVAFEDVKNMLEGKISVLEWLRAVATSDAHFIFSVRDVMPFLFATYIHARQGLKHALRAVLSAIK
jgi:predicted ATP-grasp superfamily ATP-dependent carboligase